MSEGTDIPFWETGPDSHPGFNVVSFGGNSYRQSGILTEQYYSIDDVVIATTEADIGGEPQPADPPPTVSNVHRTDIAE